MTQNYNSVWLEPYHCVETDEPTFYGTWQNLTPSSADFYIYENAEDKTSSLAVGSISINGKVVTYKKLQSLEGGKVYVCDFIVTGTNGQTMTMKMELHVEHAWEKMA